MNKNQIQYRSLSFCERHHNPMCRVCISYNVNPTFHLVRVTEYDEKAKRVLSRTKFSQLDNSTIKHLKVSDFAISNLISIGAPLEPSPLMKHDVHTSSNLAIAAANSIIAAQSADTFQSNVQPSNI